jgi:hypothetical protein
MLSCINNCLTYFCRICCSHFYVVFASALFGSVCAVQIHTSERIESNIFHKYTSNRVVKHKSIVI